MVEALLEVIIGLTQDDVADCDSERYFYRTKDHRADRTEHDGTCVRHQNDAGIRRSEKLDDGSDSVFPQKTLLLRRSKVVTLRDTNWNQDCEKLLKVVTLRDSNWIRTAKSCFMSQKLLLSVIQIGSGLAESWSKVVTLRDSNWIRTGEKLLFVKKLLQN